MSDLEAPVYAAWERIGSVGIDDVKMYRSAYPGGWLIATDTGMGLTITFAPDAKHAWEPLEPLTTFNLGDAEHRVYAPAAPAKEH